MPGKLLALIKSIISDESGQTFMEKYVGNPFNGYKQSGQGEAFLLMHHFYAR